MELLVSDYFVKNIKDSSDLLGQEKKTLLWVWHADKVPPHIGISVDARYFSLKANGKDEMIPTQTVQEIIDRKKIKTLCFELSNVVDVDELKSTFTSYDKTVANHITCLNPIKEILQTPKASRLVEMLDFLYDDQRVLDVYGFHIDDAFTGIKDYKIGDIHNRLKSLENG